MNSQGQRLCPSTLHRPNPTNLFPELTIEIDLTGEVEDILDPKTIAPHKEKEKWLIQNQVEESVNRPPQYLDPHCRNLFKSRKVLMPSAQSVIYLEVDLALSLVA